MGRKRKREKRMKTVEEQRSRKLKRDTDIGRKRKREKRIKISEGIQK